ncbi:unnamed protein product [Cyprideis torosa]|uniref:Uncharacterized protein n=1 Tax=Cyprideis torosa TaxID=163714 RepID=A0A7R8WI59_9CRUS|nr:unnamed protein product [Cyprideis torosa]CAG0897489.1 unnamed protein product [Cyprideis torosa]
MNLRTTSKFLALLVLLIAGTQRGAALKCYFCGDPDEWRDPTADDAAKWKDVDCGNPHEYECRSPWDKSCQVATKENGEQFAACAPDEDGCIDLGYAEICYCKTDLCNLQYLNPDA